MEEILPPYFLKRIASSRHIRVSVSAGGVVKVTAPKKVGDVVIKDFLISKREWLLDKVAYFKKIPAMVSTKVENNLYLKNKEKALIIAKQKVAEWNQSYGFSFGKVSIRNSHSRWGSCSSKGTLTFNYKIVFLPEPLVDYLVVHEICHLKERNHSKNFWVLVEKFIPDYIARRKDLRQFEISFKPSLPEV